MLKIRKSANNKKRLRQISSLIVAVFFLSYLLPALIISNGVEQYSGKEKEFAYVTLDWTEQALSSPSFYKIYVTKLQVTNVKKSDYPCNDHWSGGNYEADVKFYTYFGLLSNLRFHVKCLASYQEN